MNDVKILRRKCDELKRDHSSIKSRKRFIVISGKIMEHNLNGWLQAYNSVSSSNESSSVNTKPTRKNLPVTSRISSAAIKQLVITIKKRGWSESSGSHIDTIIDASAKPVVWEPTIILQRNNLLDKQLRDNHLSATDVIGDGNCFYRAVCVSVNGSQDAHAFLCKQLAVYVNLLTAFSDACVPLKRLAADILKTRSWADKEVTLASANFLLRTFYVYCASGIMPRLFTRRIIQHLYFSLNLFS